MSDILLSICIPVYNAEKYILSCVESIEKCMCDSQNYEIVLYDDCSTDCSCEILSEKININQRIKLYKGTTNLGVSHSRNVTLKNAKGDYIWFVDSDDMICINKVLELVKKLKDEDIDACCLCFSKIDCNEFAIDNHTVNFSDDKCVVSEPYNDFNPFVWRHIIKRSLICDTAISFDTSMWHTEDRLFLTELYLHLNSYLKYNDNCYLYRENQSSVSHYKKSLEKNINFYLLQKNLIEKVFSFKAANEAQQHFLNVQKEQIKEIVAMALILISDTSYVKREYKALKKRGYYPYQANTTRLKSKSGFVRKYSIYLLNRPFFFWLQYYLMKIVKR